jgi:hypothetical protein
MIALRVIRDALGGYFLKRGFERAHVAGARDFGKVRKPEDEVAETELLSEESTQVPQQRG